MERIHIVLVEPQIPQNTGNIARTCACTGASLHLVGPMGFVVDDKKLKRAGLDYWHFLDLHYYENLADFQAKHPEAACWFFTTKGRHRYTHCLRLPMIDEARSLNLSNSVAVGVYEVLRQWDFPKLKESGELTKYHWEE